MLLMHHCLDLARGLLMLVCTAAGVGCAAVPLLGMTSAVPAGARCVGTIGGWLRAGSCAAGVAAAGGLGGC